MTVANYVDDVNIEGVGCGMAELRRRRNTAARRSYHHGDLRRALVEEALRTIQTHGVDELTLRSIGTKIGVSRTALYRHFPDKSALLAAVGREGFRLFRTALEEAQRAHTTWRDGFRAMGRAYVEFAREHSSHYQVMFGGFLDACDHDPELRQEGAAAFQTLVDAIVSGQREGLLVEDDPATMARFVWSALHGVSMLAIDGPLQGETGERAIAYTLERTMAAISVS